MYKKGIGFLLVCPMFLFSQEALDSDSQKLIDSSSKDEISLWSKKPNQKVAVKSMRRSRQGMTTDERLDALESKVREINPSARPYSKNNGGYATGELIYWRASTHAFPLAEEFLTNPINITTIPLAINIIRQGFDFDPGAKVGLGWNTPKDGWDLYLNWTGYYNHSTRTAVSASGDSDGSEGFVINHLLFANESPGGMPDLKGSWKLNYNTLDFELGTAFYLRRTFSLRPELGIRSAWIHQRFKTKGTGGSETTFHSSTVEFSVKNRWWGIGPRAGVRADWWLGSGFSIFGNASTALLLGRFSANSVVKAVSLTTRIFQDVFTTADKYTDFFPTAQLAGGFSWGSSFSKDRYYFSASAAWEVNYWWDQTNFWSSVSNDIPFAVSLGGLTASLKFDY